MSPKKSRTSLVLTKIWLGNGSLASVASKNLERNLIITDQHISPWNPKELHTYSLKNQYSGEADSESP